MIIDSVLDADKQEAIKHLITGEDFPWFWRDGLIKFDVAKHNEIADRYTLSENPMFMHQITKLKQVFNPKLYDSIIVPVLHAFQEKTGMRVKAVMRSQINLIPKLNISADEYSASLHRDLQLDSPVDQEKFISILYYPIHSDGPTITYNEDLSILESCDPVQGRLFYYKSTTLHRLTVPKTSNKRLSININIEIF